jgi:hypothetical protein
MFMINLGPLRCLMSTRMEHSGECIHERSIEAFSDTICSLYLILDVDMEVL